MENNHNRSKHLKRQKMTEQNKTKKIKVISRQNTAERISHDTFGSVLGDNFFSTSHTCIQKLSKLKNLAFTAQYEWPQSVMYRKWQ